ncbi:MAG TPA: tyrosine--tRNA ligase [Candidatus Limnocylindria bacterium]|nr:tyrosine--tRNA ligase [Candidatus Limnocylindria bacterium]
MDRSGPSHLLDDLAWRGMIAHATDLDALRAALDAGPVTLYCGFDPTAPSLHFGNLVQLVTLRRFQEAGHRVIAVVGGATGLVGDPSGRSEERVLNAEEVVAGWVDRIRVQVEGVLRFDGDNPARIVNNLEWTGPMPVLAFLRDVGKHFTVSRMLAKEVVATRLEAGISYTEFSYQILQANDFLELYRRHGVTLQTGGSDQWGNLTAGVDLIRRVEGAEVHALATPLITKADGTKFGKTAGDSIWMDAAMTTPYAFYQYFLNQADADAGALLRAFSFRSPEEIEALERAIVERPERREAQRVLAHELTSLVHADAAADAAVAASEALFGTGDLAALDATTLEAATADLPRARVERPLPSVVDLLVATGLAPSRGQARRTVAEGGAYVNNVRVADPGATPAEADLLHGRWLILRRGKRAIAAVECAERGVS